MNLNPRFRNEEEALRYLDCVRNRKPVPPEIWVFPFIQTRNGLVIRNPEYENAPFEAALVDQHGNPGK